jgi:hypothetical protein
MAEPLRIILIADREDGHLALACVPDPAGAPGLVWFSHRRPGVYDLGPAAPSAEPGLVGYFARMPVEVIEMLSRGQAGPDPGGGPCAD